MKSMLNPSYVIQEQSYDKGSGAGRVADLGPALDRWSRQPFLGSGFGTRVADPNAQAGSESQILDDQWLGTLLEIGALGALSPAVALHPRDPPTDSARNDRATGPDGWLLTALAAAIDRVRGRDAHVRRVRVRPGDVPVVHHARACGRGHRRRRASNGRSSLAPHGAASRGTVGRDEVRHRGVPREAAAVSDHALAQPREQLTVGDERTQVLGQRRLVAGRVDESVRLGAQQAPRWRR